MSATSPKDARFALDTTVCIHDAVDAAVARPTEKHERYDQLIARARVHTLKGLTEPSAWRVRQERARNAPLAAPSIRPDVRMGTFLLAFVAMLCSMLIGVVSGMRPLTPDSPDRGYDEALGIQTDSVPCTPANGSDGKASIAGSLTFGPTRPANEAAVACVAASAAASLQPTPIGNDK